MDAGTQPAPWPPDQRRPRARHIERFPCDLVAVELDTAALLSLRELLHHSYRFGRPHRGYRADHWTKTAIMDVNNQLARFARIERRNAA